MLWGTGPKSGSSCRRPTPSSHTTSPGSPFTLLVTFHSGRFLVEAPDLSSDEAFLHFLDLIRETIPTAIRDIMTCKPDHILMGMSAETFWGGKEGNAAFSARVAAIAGEIGITSGAAA